MHGHFLKHYVLLVTMWAVIGGFIKYHDFFFLGGGGGLMVLFYRITHFYTNMSTTICYFHVFNFTGWSFRLFFSNGI